MKRHDDEIHVDEDIVRRLLRTQFPQWADLPLTLVEEQGTDHTLYRLGDDMVVRMPIRPGMRQAEREARWIPFLAPQVPLRLPMPLAHGAPGEGYPSTWSIVEWPEGGCGHLGSRPLVPRRRGADGAVDPSCGSTTTSMSMPPSPHGQSPGCAGLGSPAGVVSRRPDVEPHCA